MFGENHYVPVLKGKQGELWALGEIKTAEKEHFTPLWEILLPDDSDRKNKKPPSKRLAKNAKDLSAHWGYDFPIFVDPLLLDHGMELPGGKLPFTSWADAAELNGIRFIPTTGIGRPIKEHQAIKDLIWSHDLCLRLQMADMEFDDWQEDLEEFLAYFELTSKQVHLILDLETIPALPLPAYINGVSEMIKMIPDLDQWITFSLVAGSFPESLANFDRDEIGKTPRREWLVWNGLKKKRLIRRPAFGDYAVANPSLPDVDPKQMRPSAAIRYTSKEDWIIIKGKGAIKHGFDQFHQLSKKLLKRSEYMGPGFSWGDAFVERCAQKTDGPGNLTTWRKVGTNHHIKFVIDQLASLDGA